MEWVYQGQKYVTKPINIYYSEPYHFQECENWDEILDWYKNERLVYHTKWDRCYKLIAVRLAGNGHRLKAWVIDIHTNRQYVCSLQDLEIVEAVE